MIFSSKKELWGEIFLHDKLIKIVNISLTTFKKNSLRKAFTKVCLISIVNSGTMDVLYVSISMEMD